MTVSSPATESSRGQTSCVIDEDHLGRMTLGDRSLEREILEIFGRQTALMLTRIEGAEPARAAAAAHTLKGSACGIGAWRVVQAAERLEQAAAGLGDFSEAVAELEAASTEVRAAIAARLDNRLRSDPDTFSGRACGL
jgi:HPt (histidine-containing phosphotransfer) domain-containing protein